MTVDAQQVETWKIAAENGEADAKWHLANAYYRGTHVEKDFENALKLWREAEEHYGGEEGEELWVVRLRAFLHKNDARIIEAYEERPSHNNGLACYLYGFYLRKFDIPKAVEIFARGKDLDHVGCKVAFLKLSNPGFRRLLVEPKIIWTLVSAFPSWWRNEEDPRWRT